MNEQSCFILPFCLTGGDSAEGTLDCSQSMDSHVASNQCSAIQDNDVSIIALPATS